MCKDKITGAPESTPQIFAVPCANNINENCFSALYQFCSSERRQKVKSFQFREDACRSLTGEALIRYAIFANTQIMENGSSFITNSYGKPSLPNSSLQFNISHSGKWVVCAIDRFDIGIDIEKNRNVSQDLSSNFSPEEKELLSECTCEKHFTEVFFRIWTLKESYIKSIGEGFSCPFDSFACIPGKECTVELKRYNQDLPTRHLKTLSVEQGYSSAVCTTEKFKQIAVTIISVSDLIGKLGIGIYL